MFWENCTSWLRKKMRGLEKIVCGEITLRPVWQQFVDLRYQCTLGCKNMFIEFVIKSRNVKSDRANCFYCSHIIRIPMPFLTAVKLNMPTNTHVITTQLMIFQTRNGFCLAQHSGASLSSWNDVQSKCFEGTCLFNIANHNEKDEWLSPSRFYGITLPHQAHCYLCN